MTLDMAQTRCPETAVTKLSFPRCAHIPERRPQLRRCKSVKFVYISSSFDHGS